MVWFSYWLHSICFHGNINLLISLDLLLSSTDFIVTGFVPRL